jgi:hypothetical protein
VYHANEDHHAIVSDAYGMALQGLHIDACRKLKLKPKDWLSAFQSAFMVWCIQLTLIWIVTHHMLFNVNEYGDKVFLMIMAPDLTKFVARFIAILLMHWCVKNDIEAGLKTM